MELILERIAKKKGYTIGRLKVCPSPPEGRDVDIHNCASSCNQTPPPPERLRVGELCSEMGLGEAFCDTLEPIWRDYEHGAYKIKGRSAIPEGRYAVVISYSPKFKQWLPILLGVPKFKGIRIHAGNTVKDTEGCILVGQNKLVGRLVDSRIWLHRLKQLIVEAKGRGEAVWITVK